MTTDTACKTQPKGNARAEWLAAVNRIVFGEGRFNTKVDALREHDPQISPGMAAGLINQRFTAASALDEINSRRIRHETTRYRMSFSHYGPMHFIAA